MTLPEEEVVLVDDDNNVIGTILKSEVHSADTPLHRGFSIFLFNARGELLLQQRSHLKKTWPLAWSNSCCGHPGLDETNEDAAMRRVRFELGAEARDVRLLLPYRYQCVKDGVMENEICPVLVGRIEAGDLRINPDEVEAARWVAWEDFLREFGNDPEKYSPWCQEEARLLDVAEEFRMFRERR
jgi:isopentenyl-diphosphate delta-isomerase